MEKNIETLLQKAEHLVEIERWREAVPPLLKVLGQNPEHFQANCLLGACHFYLKNYVEALEFTEKAIAVAPDDEWGHRLRSIILGEMGRKKEALKSAEEAVRLNPFELFGWQALTNAYLNCNKILKAKETAIKMREHFPESEYSFFSLGNVYLQAGNPYEAEKSFREALRLDPNFSDARNNLGVALLRQRKSDEISLFNTPSEDEIRQHFSEAVKLEPENEIAAENLKSQYSYRYALYSFLSFLPFYTLAFFIAPGWSIIIFLISFFGIAKLLRDIRRKRKDFSPEMLLFLKSKKCFPIYFDEFLKFAAQIYKKTWKPHALLIFAVILCHMNFGETAGNSSRTWNQAVAWILLIVSLIWLNSEISKD